MSIGKHIKRQQQKPALQSQQSEELHLQGETPIELSNPDPQGAEELEQYSNESVAPGQIIILPPRSQVEILAPNTHGVEAGENVISVRCPVEINKPELYVSYPRVDVRLNVRQAAALRRLRCSLAERNERYDAIMAKHERGKVVDSDSDAIRWLLDKIADGIDGIDDVGAS